ncbi:hypothetical protein FOL47_006385 [Perkinsus chesapeaki]|uniref:subtilisin n=1 Tax=Perkinsus chesapeaki TaxID=330153 RepID=A0A7J6LT55_PERCH|nr:hypothetical protein FOL47_006385 [Perkinsus chesapeaki]
MLHRCFVLGCVLPLNIANLGVTGAFPVNDPLYWQQAPYLEAVNVTGAWRRLHASGVVRKSVTVALIETGAQMDHPDLVANLVEGYNVIDGSHNTDDIVGHGTAMAGILGATINNKVGMAGVMDLVNIMPISAVGLQTPQTLSAGIDYVINNREAKGIQFILFPFNYDVIEPYLADQFKRADQAGILIIVTAGNLGKDITTEKRYPCALTEQFSSVLCVAATEQSEMKLTYSANFADYVDVAAPGLRIMATGLYNTYKPVPGSSASSAIVAGVVAMLYSLDPTLSPADIKKIIKETSKKGLTDHTGKVVFPFGLVDAEKAVAKLIQG